MVSVIKPETFYFSIIMRAADVIKYLGNNFKFLQILTSKKLWQIFEDKILKQITK